MLTAHQVIRLRRLLPDAEIECREDEVMVEFPDGSAAGVEICDGKMVPFRSILATPPANEAVRVLREMLGC